MATFIAADHRGFSLKEFLKTQFPDFIDGGATSLDPDDDYPDLASSVCTQMKQDDKAILICGSGHGMDMVANRYPHIRAILGFNNQVVEQGRAHEDANVLVLPSDWITNDQATKLITLFINTPFSQEPRHLRRLQKLSSL